MASIPAATDKVWYLRGPLTLQEAFDEEYGESKSINLPKLNIGPTPTFVRVATYATGKAMITIPIENTEAVIKPAKTKVKARLKKVEPASPPPSLRPASFGGGSEAFEKNAIRLNGKLLTFAEARRGMTNDDRLRFMKALFNEMGFHVDEMRQMQRASSRAVFKVR
jgi:hypothetical protein